MTYTPLASEKPWQPPIPADPLFVARCRANLLLARKECEILIAEETRKRPSRENKYSRSSSRRVRNGKLGRQRILNEEQIREFHKLYASGISSRTIMEPVWDEIGFSTHESACVALMDAFRSHGLPRRPRGRPRGPLIYGDLTPTRA